MLELKNIHKHYAVGANEVRALQGIDLQFRKNEFVAILGPSGCGKTTMLNIIGGLDQYSEGDLIIDGISTKDYRDRQWDTYRNHSVGFVFQSYNLIPHQSVLANVELALTLSGVGRKERRERAKRALEQVGLGDQLRKRPGEMSGGQMQRVAIARALVNNPDIILADEPTGALDTTTSVQVMEILKEISRDRLVVMVTHNPELAETYATRTVRMLDGRITADSMPLNAEEQQQLRQEKKTGKPEKVRKPSMSLFTAFSLSLKNLFTKKGRTVLTSFAGSIGIIGIALIYAVSQGTTGFIDDLQEDTLASYPLTLEASTLNMASLIESFMDVDDGEAAEHELDGVYSKTILFDMFNALNKIETTENDLNAFKKRIDAELQDPESELSKALSGVEYSYNFDLLVYTKDPTGKIIVSDPQQLLTDVMAKNFRMDMTAAEDMQGGMNTSAGSSMMTGPGIALWDEMLPGKDGSMISPLVKGQYDLVYGDWPNSYDEVVLVVDENYELDDLTLFALGLKPQEEMEQMFKDVAEGVQVDTTQEKWSFESLMDMQFRVVLNSRCYVYNEALGLYSDLRETDAGVRYLYDDALQLRVSGIITPNPDATSAMLRGSIGYTKDLTEYIIGQVQGSDAINTQMENPTTDILTGLPFKDQGAMTQSEKAQAFRDQIARLDDNERAKAYIGIMSIPEQQVLDDAVAFAMQDADRAYIEATMIQAVGQQMALDAAEVERYIQQMSDEELEEIYAEMVRMEVRAQSAARVELEMSQIPTEQLTAFLDEAMKDYTDEQCAMYYEEVLEFSQSTYEDNLAELGYVQLDDPATINLYASSFENKDHIEAFITEYNDSVEELQKIHYTDYIGLMMSSITIIIDAITYVLIAFVAISLVVSSIMIGVITLISVQERTKEIGILRAIGASKANVSSMFNAETVIIGFASGVLGVLMTYVLCIPINIIIQELTGLPNLTAHLPVPTAVLLVAISIVLTLISGVIPSRSAAKKDPVVALRTE